MRWDIMTDSTFALPADETTLQRAAGALKANGFDVHVVDTLVEARDLVRGLLPRDQPIFTATSETLRVSGLAADIDESGGYVSVRASAGPLDDVRDRIRLGATPEVVVGSVHAVTEDGRLLTASASGSQLAPYGSGARTAVWVVGSQKIVPDVETGLRRLREHSLVLEGRRLRELVGQESFISRILIIENEFMPGRSVVVLVRETAGF
ncbi:hypothetical protein Hesp01_13920 [Herbidospora sp. NBRC 101105]|nr:hypothetical protein Hesp01_13920 [Herbidospora sp. NBRC 101105]